MGREELLGDFGDGFGGGGGAVDEVVFVRF